MLVCTDAGKLNLLHSAATKQPAVSLPQIYVPLGFPARHPFHRETGKAKGIIHLITHFKSLQSYSGSDNCPQLVWDGSTMLLHKGYSMPHYISYCSAPSCMNGRHSSPFRVVKQYRNTVCRTHTNTQTWCLRYHSIHSF